MFPTDLRGLFACAAVCALAISPTASAQHLRQGVLAAELVVVAVVDGVMPLGNEVFLHKLRPLRTLAGSGTTPERLTIVEQRGVSDRPKPVLGTTRLYCLKPTPNVDLPPRHGPYYELTGFLGDHPIVDLDAEPLDPTLEFVELLLRAESTTGAGIAPRDFCNAMLEIALERRGAACAEAVEVLRVRDMPRSEIDPVQKSRLLARAIGETDDLELKLALASLCVELRLPDVVDSLCLSMASTEDERFARRLGELARFAHGEAAIDVLRPHITRARDASVQGRLLLALGATRTDAALDALLQYRRTTTSPTAAAAVDAALLAHGTVRAMEAVAPRTPERDR